MIAKLKGTISELFPDFVIIEVGGVGYRVETVKKAYLVDQEVNLYIYTHIREQEHRLFGMEQKEEYLLFVDLLDIGGVGPKAALMILSQLTLDNIFQAVKQKDAEALKVKGIGQKTAERIIVDLTPKLANYDWQADVPGTNLSKEFTREAKAALDGLGFSKSELEQIVKEYTATGGEEQLEAIIKFALKFINKPLN